MTWGTKEVAPESGRSQDRLLRRELVEGIPVGRAIPVIVTDPSATARFLSRMNVVTDRPSHAGHPNVNVRIGSSCNPGSITRMMLAGKSDCFRKKVFGVLIQVRREVRGWSMRTLTFFAAKSGRKPINEIVEPV